MVCFWYWSIIWKNCKGKEYLFVYIFVLENHFSGSVGIKMKQWNGDLGPCLFEWRKNNQVSWPKVSLFCRKSKMKWEGEVKNKFFPAGLYLWYLFGFCADFFPCGWRRKVLSFLEQQLLLRVLNNVWVSTSEQWKKLLSGALSAWHLIKMKLILCEYDFWLVGFSGKYPQGIC